MAGLHIIRRIKLDHRGAASRERTFLEALRAIVRNSSQFYKAVLVVWITLSVASVLLAAVTWLQLTHRLAASRNVISLHEEVDKLLNLVLEVEAGVRGFVITGDESFLKPLTETTPLLPPIYEKLLELTHEQPDLLKQVNELRAQVELSLNSFNQEVALRRSKGFSKAAEFVSSGESRRIIAQIRGLVAQIRSVRLYPPSGEGQEIRGQLWRAALTSLVAGILGIGAGLLAFWLSQVMLQQQQRERVLIEAKLAAEHSSQEKTTFLANVSHEIRTPMNAILGFSELLQGERLEPRLSEFVQSIRTSATSMLQLLNDILDMSKVEAGVMEVRTEPTDLREICDFVRTLFCEPTAKKGLELNFRLAEDLPRALLLDRIRVRQILVNLVGNALKFTDRGFIEVRIQWAKQTNGSQITLLIEVQDSGVGIPPDKLAAVFKPFVQAGAHRDKDLQGTGLGLAIVQRVTDIMGGTITAVSAPGQGSTFCLRLPNVPISARLPSAETMTSPEEVDFNQFSPAMLLVVDDNETNCELIAGMLHGSHHRLVFGTSGQDAIDQARIVKPNLILLDIRMPGMDGREACRHIRSEPGLELVPIIAVTASSMNPEELETNERFNGYIRKPFSKRELFDELAQFLPRDPARAPGPTAAGAISVAGATLPNTCPEPAPGLLNELHQLRDQAWPAVRDRMGVNEAKAFGRTLEDLARKWNYPPLTSYAQTLINDAEKYAVADLEKQVMDFGGLVDQIGSAKNS
jgi:signal transduction histidine kinase/CheY-like chemotaxis protein